jgi:hypothetical protein
MTTKYHGVGPYIFGGFSATINIPGVPYACFLSACKSPEAAAQLYDNAAYYFGRMGLLVNPPLNFPECYRDPEKAPCQFRWTRDVIKYLRKF